MIGTTDGRPSVRALGIGFALMALACGQDPTQSSATSSTDDSDPSESSTTTEDPSGSSDSTTTTIEFAEPVLVKSVVDGDTIEILRNGVEFRIRFKGVNTPELYADAGPEAFAQEARDFVWDQIGAEEIGLEFDSDCGPQPFDDCYDGYGRLLAYIRMSNGNDLAEELLAAGLARVYRYQNEIYDRMDAYYAAQSRAQDSGLGIWSN
ncbi:MAG: thermonuclease family protein [Myxococcota bacterium]|nr:thermonuclease family protein [Myxococcota bacterium]